MKKLRTELVSNFKSKMQYRNTLISILIAAGFWFFESVVHFFVFKEAFFELIPDSTNELWMRILIILLLISFGFFTDLQARKLLQKEKLLESTQIYESTLSASQHIINNLLNQMMVFRIEADRSQDFDPEILALYDDAVVEATDLLNRLSSVNEMTGEEIRASVAPKATHTTL